MQISSRDGVIDVRSEKNSALYSDPDNQLFHNNCDKMIMQFMICHQCHDAINTSTTSVVRTIRLLFFNATSSVLQRSFALKFDTEEYGNAKLEKV